MDLFSRYFGRVGCMTRTDIVGVHLRFDATRRKTAYGNYSKNLGVIQSYGNLQPVLWSWLWDVPKDVVGMQ
jgi:hypothetical protein